MLTPWVRFYLSFYRKALWSLALCSIALIAQPAILIATFWIIRYVFDNLIAQGKLLFLLFTGCGIIGLLLLSSSVYLLVRYFSTRITNTSVQAFHEEVLKRVYSLSRLYYSQADRKELHTILVNDLIHVDIMTNAVVGKLIPATIVTLLITLILLYFQPLLFISVFSIFPLLYIMQRAIKPALNKFIRKQRNAYGTLSSKVMFALEALDLTHLRAAQQEEIMEQLSTAARFRAISLKLMLFKEGHAFIQDMLTIASSMVCLLLGGVIVARGGMTLGELFSFYTATLLLRPYLRTLWATIPGILEGIESLQRLYDLLQVANLSPYAGREKITFSGNITLENVSFGYNHRTILQDVNLSIRPQSIVVIMGPNGAGKSTIVNLILGFYRPQTGRLLADGQPFDVLDINHLRQFIGVAPQNPFIFSGTVLENISYGCPEVGEAEVWRATRLATADAFIAELPNGYDTLIGHNGLLLSGGQCQRIALARALLRHPRLLILDEPTNHLDATAIHRFIQNLKNLEDMPACIMITHNIDIINEADYIYFLEEGKIVARGNDGVFADLRDLYSPEFNEI